MIAHEQHYWQPDAIIAATPSGTLILLGLILFMEIQKNLFKLSEKILLNSTTKNTCIFLAVFSSLLTLFSLTVFAIGVTHYPAGAGVLEKCYTMDNPLVYELFQSDVIMSIEFENIHKPMFVPPQKYLFLNNSDNNCVIYKNLEKKHDPHLSYTGTPNLPTLNKETFINKSFDNYTVLVSPDSLTSYQKLIFGESQLLINELLESQFFKNSPFYQITYRSENLYFRKFIKPNRLWTLLKTFLGIFVLSVVSLLYIYATIISAPAFIINIIDIFKIHNAIHRVTVYKVFPWIGIFMHPLDQYQNERKSSKYINNAAIFEFALVYFIYFGLMIGVGNFLFIKPILGAINQNFFGIIAAAEFCSLVFLRTRTSIKYFPTIFIALQWMFAYYCCLIDFGYKNWLLTFSLSGSLFTLSFLILKLEIPSQSTWSKQMTYTPTEQRPRTLYLPHYNLLWNNDIPDLEMLAVPAFNRTEFLPEELALVDENFDLLGEMLTVNEQQ